MRDIAAECGVSATTVSKALRNDPSISAPRAETIRDTAKRLRYRPNRLVAGVMQGKSRTVAMIRSWKAEALPGAVADNTMAAVDRLIDRDFCPIFLNTDKRVEREAHCIELAIQNRVSGILIATANFTANEEYFAELRDNRIPFVMLEPFAEQVDVPRVHADNRHAGYSITKHLIDLGHRNIAHLGEPVMNHARSERFEGYKDALREHDLPVRPELLRATDFSYASGFAETRALLRLAESGEIEPFSAIFAGTFNLAFGAIEAIEKAGLRVPTDYSVAGSGVFRTFPHFHRLRLTTFDQHAGESGRLAADLLLDRVAGRIPDEQWDGGASILLRGDLVVGDTTAPARKRTRLARPATVA